MSMTETIEWHPASEPPDNDRTVMGLVDYSPIPVPTRYSSTKGQGWCYEKNAVMKIDYWAELPRGPQP